MSGVEIQLSIEDATNGDPQEGSDTVHETEESTATPSAAGTATRIQGQLSLSHASSTVTKSDFSSCTDNATSGSCWASKNPHKQ